MSISEKLSSHTHAHPVREDMAAYVAYSFKVVLLGEGCVGKTSLVLRYIEDKFNSKHISTLQASFVTKKVTLADGQRVQLNIWDTAGQERFHALGPIYYRGSNGAVLVYDITDQDSFLKVKNWVRELKRMLGAEITIIIVGNKIDLEPERNVSYEDALKYSKSVAAHYVETSAKLNEGVTKLFDILSHLMAERRDTHASQGQEVVGRRINRDHSAIALDEDTSSVDVTRRRRGGFSHADDSRPTTPDSENHRSCCGGSF